MEYSRREMRLSCENSSVNITATVHRTGYTNRTDIPVELCIRAVHQVVGSIHNFLHGPLHIKFAAAPAILTDVSSTSFEAAFSLHDNEFENERWEQQTGRLNETDFDRVYCLSPIQASPRYLTGNAGLLFIPMQNQRPVKITPVHYLSSEARQPAFVDVSDIADLHSMTTEELDLLASIAQPSIKMFEGGRRLPDFYFDRIEQPIFVGDTWLNKVLSVEGQHERDHNMDGSVFKL
ncbi:hypothetical protein DFJ58DRAFT_913099 [Suillus subalutaceus]|uniref:uncharacterized protein n=1 Tax=Suillus subalutaceus TaxID=48586 RepID=UPI001B86C23D|nr:uncharacterized protein DFJ58DRAFT_913099 [Suillus subalutaceus]KAG1859526.1 hypothetical protein DFJ58DRAFT_913099 [Suillus subalutaceus]